jgi:GNAT superfamily N-acetyltransferase
MASEPTWREIFRQGVAPQFSLPGLKALRDALRDDDPRLIQGSTVCPVVLLAGEKDELIGACLLAYPFWQGDGFQRLRMVESAAAEVAAQAAAKVGRFVYVFLHFYDHTPRAEAFRELLPEVEAVIKTRLAAEGVPCTGSTR